MATVRGKTKLIQSD